jgi:hypothetical protein
MPLLVLGGHLFQVLHSSQAMTLVQAFDDLMAHSGCPVGGQPHAHSCGSTPTAVATDNGIACALGFRFRV